MNISITQRPVRPDDEGFLFEVYASTRAEEMSQVPWDASQRDSFLKMQFASQQQDYQRRFPDGDHRVILVDEGPIGRLYVARSKHEIRILDIAILPEQRGKGIGTQLITNLLEEAARAQKPLRIYVEQTNPSLRLFERLGFSRAEDIGSHFLMEWPRGPW
ncbi:MAG: GNAT family N-acetyltransferase [Acidobacteriota bacterium]